MPVTVPESVPEGDKFKVIEYGPFDVRSVFPVESYTLTVSAKVNSTYKGYINITGVKLVIFKIFFCSTSTLIDPVIGSHFPIIVLLPYDAKEIGK